MARARLVKTSFNAGEISDLTAARSELRDYSNAVERLRNMVTLPQGGARTRPGTRFIDEIAGLSGGGVSNVRVAEFQFSTEQTYFFLFSHLKLQIFRDGAQVASLVTPWESDDLTPSFDENGEIVQLGISWANDLDTMLVFHEDYEIRKIERQGSHTSWAISTFSPRNVPLLKFSGTDYSTGPYAGTDEVQEINLFNYDNLNWQDGDTISFLLFDYETDALRYTSNAATMAQRIEDALNALDDVDDGDITVAVNAGGDGTAGSFEVTFSGDSVGAQPVGALYINLISTKNAPRFAVEITTKGEYAGEPVWSATRGYPRTGMFYQKRLWLGGSRSLPHFLWGSRPFEIEDFNSKRIDDDFGIAAQCDENDVPAIVALHAGRHLQIFTTSSEFYVPLSESTAITPGNIVIRRTTSYGAQPGIRVFDVGGGAIFVQRRGRALREAIYTDNEQAYSAGNLTLLSPDILRDPVALARRRSSASDDADYLYVINGDGTLAVLCTLRSENVNGFGLWETNGQFIDAVAVLDTVYVIVKREVDGEDVLMIEALDDDLLTDCAVTGGASATGTAAHLPGATLQPILDGLYQPELEADDEGTVTFLRESETEYELGLRWPVVLGNDLIWGLRTLPPEREMADGFMSGRKKRIVDLVALLKETTALTINGNIVSFRSFGSDLLDQPVSPYSGYVKIKSMLGYSREANIIMGASVPSRATIIGLSYGVAI